MPKNCKTPHGKPSRARVMWGDPNNNCNVTQARVYWATVPSAVIPCTTRQSARSLVKWANMTREQRMGMVAKALCRRRLDEDLNDHSQVSLATRQEFINEARAIDALYFGATEDGK